MRKIVAVSGLLAIVLSLSGTEQNFKQEPSWTKESETLFYRNKTKDRRFTPDVTNMIRQKIWSDMKKSPQWEEYKRITEFQFEKLEDQLAVEALPRDADIHVFEDALKTVMPGLRELGYEGTPTLVPVDEFEDIKDVNEVSNGFDDTLYIVQRAGLRRNGKINTTTFRGEKNSIIIHPHVSFGRGGVHEVPPYELREGKFHAQRGKIFISNQNRDKVRPYSSAFCEILHVVAHNIGEQIYNKLIKIKQVKGGVELENRAYATFVTATVDESLVHGIFHHYLTENQKAWGLSDEDVKVELNVKREIPTYSGCDYVREQCDKKGRIAVFEEYRKNPLKLWDELKSRNPKLEMLANGK